MEPTGTPPIKPLDIEETLGKLPLEQLVEEIFQSQKGTVILEAVLHKRLVEEVNKLNETPDPKKSILSNKKNIIKV